MHFPKTDINSTTQFPKNRFCHHPNNPTNLNLRLQPNLLQFEQQCDQKTPLTQSSPKISSTLQALRCQYAEYSSQHRTQFISLYLILFITWWHTQPYVLTTSNWTKNTFTMSKSPPKRLKGQSNQINIIYCHVKVKRPKKLWQQSYLKSEAMKVTAIMEQLNESDGNEHLRRNNTNNFAPLYESYN